MLLDWPLIGIFALIGWGMPLLYYAYFYVWFPCVPDEVLQNEATQSEDFSFLIEFDRNFEFDDLEALTGRELSQSERELFNRDQVVQLLVRIDGSAEKKFSGDVLVTLDDGAEFCFPLEEEAVDAPVTQEELEALQLARVHADRAGVDFVAVILAMLAICTLAMFVYFIYRYSELAGFATLVMLAIGMFVLAINSVVNSRKKHVESENSLRSASAYPTGLDKTS